MSNRLSSAMDKLNVDGGARNTLGRPPTTPGTKRHSGLDPTTISAMFPDAAAAIATEKAKFTQQTGAPPTSNRNSAAYDARASLAAPTISGPSDSNDNNGQPPPSPWGPRSNDQNARPKSSSGQAPMGQFIQPPPSAGLRSPLNSNTNLQQRTIVAPDNQGQDQPLLSPYNVGNGNWASMVNTPMVPSFNTASSNTQADMIANATAMKLAALSTVNNRVALDDVRKYRRARSNDGGQGPLSPGLLPNMRGAPVVVVDQQGQFLSNEQVLALQNQQNSPFRGQRSRPSSPGLAMQGGFGQMNFASPQNNGFLAAYGGSSPLMNNMNGGMGSLNLGQFGIGGHEGYLSDHSEMARGRSPRGRRGSSKPPEDPTDPSLLQDIPSWLRSLRLHKYTDNLKDMNWTELVELDEAALEARGVNALGARRKMLKVFEQVKGSSLSPPSCFSFTNEINRSQSRRQACMTPPRTRSRQPKICDSNTSTHSRKTPWKCNE
jgi:hypothetical protein